MPRKVQKKDYKSLLENFKKKIQENDMLSSNPLLAQQLRDFERMSEMNDNLWDTIQTDGYTTINEKTGVPVVNPAVFAILRTDASLYPFFKNSAFANSSRCCFVASPFCNFLHLSSQNNSTAIFLLYTRISIFQDRTVIFYEFLI